jgi:hypothetical protein
VFRFVQWEFPGALGPGSGRYALRPVPGEEPRQVVVIEAAEASRRGRRLSGRRARSVPAEPPPATVPVTRATVVAAEPFPDTGAAGLWLADAAGAGAEAAVAEALAVLNLAVEAHRVAAADPYVREVSPSDALVTRLGYGSGEQVADGRWVEARELPPPDATRRGRRMDALRPQERVAALLGGRDAALACEEMTLRGRLDLERGRHREAALQAHLGLEAARIELAAYAGLSGMEERLGALDGHRDAIAAAANEALQGGVSAATRATVAEVLERLESALRARANAGAY